MLSAIQCFRTILAGTPEDDRSGYNKLNTSPKLSNLTEDRNSLNVKLSHGDAPSDDVIASDDVTSDADDAAFQSDAVKKVPTRRHFTSSQSDIENCGPNVEEPDYYRTSSRVSESRFIFNKDHLFYRVQILSSLPSCAC